MRRSRRGGHHAGMEFGGSGEDSFVAVVVTKLTGALLFILLLTMVIMALLPKAVDLPGAKPITPAEDSLPLAIATPGELPEAIAGRPYTLALAAVGGHGPRHWSVDGPLPAGLAVDPDAGLIRGTPTKGTPEPVKLNLRVADGSDRTSRTTQLVVYQSDRPLTTPSKWKPAIPPIPWREWFEQGFGFVVLALIHLVCMNTLNALERRAEQVIATHDDAAVTPETTTNLMVDVGRRFTGYRIVFRCATILAMAGLALWLARGQGV